ncbi:MAG: hypothetical protein KGQ79_09090, partial [Proteobacteria bacterium]|nr:hypothetical protein [Pseudomonadota bacterium]
RGLFLGGDATNDNAVVQRAEFRHMIAPKHYCLKSFPACPAQSAAPRLLALPFRECQRFSLTFAMKSRNGSTLGC